MYIHTMSVGFGLKKQLHVTIFVLCGIDEVELIIEILQFYLILENSFLTELLIIIQMDIVLVCQSNLLNYPFHSEIYVLR